MQALRYVALIGDVVASRERPDRAELQAHLLRRASELTERLPTGALATPVTLVAGDEIQALLHLEGASETVTLIQDLEDFVYGYWKAPHFAFGVGVGELTTGDLAQAPPLTANPALLDGPCFHEARAALDTARRAKQWCRFQGFDPLDCAVLNALFDLMGAIRSGWTLKQSLHTGSARVAETQRAVAEEWKVSPSVISESLKAAHYESMLAGESAARAVLEAAAARGRSA